jgi:hypothetical protein
MPGRRIKIGLSFIIQSSSELEVPQKQKEKLYPKAQ